MGGRKQIKVPRELAQARRRFLAWRRTKQPGERIPVRLWKLAVKLAGRHDLHRTVSMLKLDYYSLKKPCAAAQGPPNSVRGCVTIHATLEVEVRSFSLHLFDELLTKKLDLRSAFLSHVRCPRAAFVTDTKREGFIERCR